MKDQQMDVEITVFNQGLANPFSECIAFHMYYSYFKLSGARDKRRYMDNARERDREKSGKSPFYCCVAFSARWKQDFVWMRDGIDNTACASASKKGSLRINRSKERPVEKKAMLANDMSGL